MSLGKYQDAQTVLNSHREDIEQYFSEDHPANLSVDNNQALLWKLDGNFAESKRIFERVSA
jgi:Flp pilus assembly protein TadD